MRAGPLDRKVIILKAGPVTDAYGDEVQGYTALNPVAASKRPAPGSERLASGEAAADAPIVFKIRWRESFDPDSPTGLNPKDRLQHGGRTYDIKSVIEIGCREGIEIAAVTGAD